MRKAILALALLATLLLPGPAHAGTHWVSPRHVYRWIPLGRVWTTGYVERGLTATGTYAGPNQCATNPAWVPYGSIVKVAGLWNCRVTDTGALGWAHVDMWVPTVAQAYAITGYRQAWIRR